MKDNSTIPAEVKSEKQSDKASDRASSLNQELISVLSKTRSADDKKPRDLLVIMKDLLSPEKDSLSLEKGLSPSEDDKNKLNTRPEILGDKEGDKSDLFLKLMLALAGAVAIGASGGAGFALLAGGAGMLPVLPQLIEEGKKLFGMGDGQQNIAQNDSEDLPKKMLAVSLLEIANSGKSELADFIFSKESPFAEKIKSYTNNLSSMAPDQRNAELDNLRNEVKNLASNQASNQPSTKPDLSEKIDGIFEGLKEVLEGKSPEKKEGEKEGERDILGELKTNLSVRGILNSDGSVTTAVSETQKKEGGDKGKKSENKDGLSKEDKPSSAPASRRDDERPRAELVQPQLQLQQ